MHPDRCFDAEPDIRRVARELYEGTRALPIVSPHGHVDARLLEVAPLDDDLDSVFRYLVGR